MNNKLYIHIGCTYSKESILNSLTEKGYKIIVVDEVGLKSKDLDIPYYCVYNYRFELIIEQVDLIIDAAGFSITDCSFFTLAEGSVELLNQILMYYNKKPISHLKERFRSKYFVRNILKLHKIEELNYFTIAEHPEEIPTPPHDAYPLIVKPIESMESRNVFKVQNQDELRKACLEIFTKNKTYISTDIGEIVVEDVYNHRPHALIESVITGNKISVEVLVQDRKILFYTTVSKYDFANEFFYERADIIDPEHFTTSESDVLKSYLSSIVNALQIESSLLHIELFFKRDNYKPSFNVIEINFRFAGGAIHELIKRTHNLDLVEQHLIAISGGNNLEIHDKSMTRHTKWAAYDFLTSKSGEFEALKNSYRNEPINWAFENGEAITKLTTTRFFKLGTVFLKSNSIQELNEHLRELSSNEHEYYSLNAAQETNSASSIGDFKSPGHDASKLLRNGLIVFLITAFSITALYFYRSFEKQSKVIAATLSKTLAYHLANGEIYYVANIVHNFETGQFYNQIAVVDNNNRIIYASSESQNNKSLFYQEKIDTADYNQSLPIISDGIRIGALLYNVSYNILFLQISSIVVLISLLVIALYFLTVRFLFKRIAVSISNEAENLASIANLLKSDLEKIYANQSDISTEKYRHLLRTSSSNHNMFYDLRKSLFKMATLFKDLRDIIAEKSRLTDLLDESTKSLVTSRAQIEVAKMARQVAHDIRSPLSALNMVTSLLNEVSEDKRLIIRNASLRINDIANNLLEKSKSINTAPSAASKPKALINSYSIQKPANDIFIRQNDSKQNEIVMISALLDTIVSEKRTQYRDKLNVNIEVELRNGYGLFAEINSREISRAISNLINNSVEALNDAGKIIVTLSSQGNYIQLCIRDNGCGMPDEVVARLGEQGFSYNKNSTKSEGGSGLGIAHAKSIIEQVNGKFKIESHVDIGTTVTLLIPKIAAPNWFVEKLDLRNIKTVVSVDDDQTIHQIWSGRFKEQQLNLQHIQLPSIYAANEWLYAQNSNKSFSKDEVLFLVDFEFLGQKQTGIDFISSSGVSAQTLLVTSHYDETLLKEQAQQFGVKILPKALSPLIEIIA